MMRRFVVLVMLGAGVSYARTAAAQAPVVQRPASLRGLDDVALGTSLRVVTLANPPERFEGRFGGVHGTSLTLQLTAAPPRELSISQLLRVDEAYRDHRLGAVLGVVPGLIGVYAWDYIGPHARYADQKKRYRENVTALAISCGVGALIGGTIGWKRWRLVQTSTR